MYIPVGQRGRDFVVRGEHGSVLSFPLSLGLSCCEIAMKFDFDSRNSHFAHFHFKDALLNKRLQQTDRKKCSSVI